MVYGQKEIGDKLKLTKSKQRIYNGLVTGLSNKEMATEFKISEKTVKFHLTAIFKKLKVNSRSKAIVMHYTTTKADL